MFNVNNPLVQRLVAQGFKMSLHAYLKANRFSILLTASHPTTKALFHGRSANGDPNEALADLEKIVASTQLPTAG